MLLNGTAVNIPVHVFQWTKALISLGNIYKTGIMHCKVGLGIAFYLVCSILLLRSKIVNRVSESREIEKAVVSRVSEWLVQCRARRERAGKSPQRRPDANLTRD